MSKLYKPTEYKPRALQNAWMNNIFQTHDLWCSCNSTIKHLKEIIKEQECRHSRDAATTTETGGTTTTEETGFDEGDLESLFALTEENDEG